jgi:hypothetical protein
MRQVSKHASDETCWIVVNGKVRKLLLLLLLHFRDTERGVVDMPTGRWLVPAW